MTYAAVLAEYASTASNLPSARIARVLFCVEDGELVALHGFIKKTEKTPDAELKLAKKRMKEMKRS